jgi:hypothetical protein
VQTPQNEEIREPKEEREKEREREREREREKREKREKRELAHAVKTGISDCSHLGRDRKFCHSTLKLDEASHAGERYMFD